jgi:uncharacterized protein YbbK (DUF523 family)
MPAPILISACLLGQPVRYDGGANGVAQHPVLAAWLAAGRVLALCPELAGGLPVPRPPAERLRDAQGRERVLDVHGRDVTAAFEAGAEQALSLAREHGVRLAVLKEGSPSCGSGYVYDGSFSRRRVPGRGLTAERLMQAGIRVFSEHELEAAQRWLQALEAGDDLAAAAAAAAPTPPRKELDAS